MIRGHAFKHVKECLIHLSEFLVFDVLCSLSLGAPHGLTRETGALLSAHSFALVFRNHLCSTERSIKSSNAEAKKATHHTNPRKNHHRNAPAVKTCRSLEEVSPLQLTSFTTLSTVFAKAQSFQSKAKKKANIASQCIPNHDSSKTRQLK